MRLQACFYQQDGLTVAKNLLGKIIVREIGEQKIKAKIVETEAYLGPEDKACHAYQNKFTSRTETMFKNGGVAYVYLIYGIHNCFNVVTNLDKPEAVLIRAVEPLSNLSLVKQNRDIKSNKVEDLTNGPGKLCQALSIDCEFDGSDLIDGEQLYIIDGEQPEEIKRDKRINIDYAEEYKNKLWRFYIANNSFVSR